MRFVQPSAAGPIQGSGGGIHQKPEWLKEWIDNQGKYARLECGHRVDLKDKVTLVVVFGNKKDRSVWCYDCEDSKQVKESIGLYEFRFGVPAPKTPDEPLF